MNTTADRHEALLVVGLSGGTAPLQTRERAALGTSAARAVLRSLHASGVTQDALVLSTCNRTEVYVVVGSQCATESPRLVGETLARHTRVSWGELQRLGYVHWQERATEHLFAVIAGLDSTVLGEGEIVAQARAAVALADDEGTLGHLLEGLLQQAIACGGRVRSSTGISRGAISVSSVAIGLAEQLLEGLSGRRVLVIGAGTVASAAAHRLAVSGVQRLAIASRSGLSAASLARRVGGLAVPLGSLDEELRRAELLVSATGAPDTVISRHALLAATRGRRDPLVAIDLALPRDIEPAARELPGLALRDIDEIQRIAAQNLEGRRRELPQAWSIVRNEAQRFETWRARLDAEPLLRELRRRAEEIRRTELDRLCARYPDLDSGEIRRLDAATRSLTNRLLHEPTLRIRRAGSTASGRRRLEDLHDLFGHTSTQSSPRPRLSAA